MMLFLSILAGLIIKDVISAYKAQPGVSQTACRSLTREGKAGPRSARVFCKTAFCSGRSSACIALTTRGVLRSGARSHSSALQRAGRCFTEVALL